MSIHKEENKNQRNLTILNTDRGQHNIILYIIYFQNFNINHESLEYHVKMLLKIKTVVLRSARLRFWSWFCYFLL